MTERISHPRGVDGFDIEIADRCITVHGDLDTFTAPRFAAALTDLSGRPGRIVVDASDLVVFGAAAVDVLHTMSCDPVASGRIVIRRPTPTVRRVLEIVELAHLLDDRSSTETIPHTGCEARLVDADSVSSV